MLQRAWDRVLETKPVLLVLIGSDLSMMEALNSYGRPFHQRGREMVLGPSTPLRWGGCSDWNRRKPSMPHWSPAGCR
ncbi:hypothetical protein SHKM778_13850 [Streptomyces sp. KM77-8]|uniref:Uncharacterized protein n=1 Tax=Streptomyces haneummycinicus TaxID=3074435 RepID=A0AAT9HCQ9_9ACTN